MERTERLLDLVAFLLDAQEPVSWAELKDAFPDDYAEGSEDATERKFERDKAELLELGIPITYVQGEEDSKDGYVVDRNAYYLPDPGFTQEELAVLYTAGSAALASGAFPGHADLAHALRKIAFFSGDALVVPPLRMELGPSELKPQAVEYLQMLWQAAAARKWVQIEYVSPRKPGEATCRKVNPYGLALRRGIWSLVGYCHLRKAVRTFQVHRMRLVQVNPAKPRSPDFEPVDVDLDAYVAHFPWQHRMHPAVSVALELKGELAPLAERVFPKSQVRREPERTVVEVSVTFLDGLLRYALSLSPGVRVMGPASARERFQELALAVHKAHAACPELSKVAQ